MKSVLILNNDPRLRTLFESRKDIKSEFSKGDHFQIVLEHAKPPQLFHKGNSVDTYDLILFRKWEERRDVAVPIYHILRDLGYPVHKGDIGSSTFKNKVVQNILFHRNNIRIPKSVFIAHKYMESYLDFLESQLSYPMIMKSVNGSMGEDNYLVKSRREVLDIHNGKKQEYIFQEFIDNELDYRFLVLGFKTRYVYSRKRNKKTHVNNVSQGSDVQLLQPGTLLDLERLAEKCAKVLGRDICGLDILPGLDGNIYVLEGNAAPGLSAFYQGNELAEYIKELANDQSKPSQD